MFTGMMRDLFVWDKALSTGELATVRQSNDAKQAAFAAFSGPPIVAEMCFVPSTPTCSSSGAYTFTGS